MTMNAARSRVMVEYDTVAIDTIIEGRGPTVVLLPSLARDSEDYDDVAAGLAAAGYRCLRPQPRGVCGSTGPLEGATLHDFARDVAEVVAAQGQGKAVIVGHAYGNWVARMTAVDFPDRVKGVVIAAAASKSYPPYLTEIVTRSGDPNRPDADRLDALRTGFFAPTSDPTPWLTGWHPHVRDAQRAAAAAVKQSDWWSAGSVPLLDLQAEFDPFKPPERRNEMREDFGERVSIALIRNASHALIPEQPQAVVEAIDAWMQAIGHT